MAQPIDFRRKREPGEIIADSFVFLKTEYKPLLKLTGIYVLPFFVVYSITQVYIQSKFSGLFELLEKADPEKLVNEAGPFYINLLVTLLFNFFVQSLFCAVVYTYVQAYIFKGREKFTLREISSLFFTNALTALSAGIAVAAISFAGLFLCILPGIVMANSLSLAVFIAVFERNGIRNALFRSWFMVRAQWWNTFVINLVGVIIVWATGNLLSLPAFIGDAGAFATSPVGLRDMVSDWRWWVVGFSVLISSVASIVTYIFWALQYFNLSARFDPKTD